MQPTQQIDKHVIAPTTFKSSEEDIRESIHAEFKKQNSKQVEENNEYVVPVEQ